MLRSILILLALWPGLSALAWDETPPPIASGHQGDIAAIFHPANAADELHRICEPILLLGQFGAVAIIMGVFLSLMRREDAQMEGIASMMIKVAFIASVPLWQSLAMETADAVAESLGQRALPTSSLATDAAVDRKALSVMLQRVSELEHHWELDTSPVLDSLAGRQAVKPGDEEAWLAKGWNWVRSSHIATEPNAETQLSIAMDASRAGLVHRIVLGVGFCVQISRIAFYLAETLRLLLFYAGFALMPLFIAGLGSTSLHSPSLRALLAVAGVSLWPVGWAVANVGTISLLIPALDILGKCAGSAMYPEIAEGTTRTVALAAPYLSWTLLSLLSAITLALCLWMVATLCLIPLLMHKVLNSGASRT